MNFIFLYGTLNIKITWLYTAATSANFEPLQMKLFKNVTFQ